MSPQFSSLADFLAMGGHAPYVWGAWGLAALVIGGLWLRNLAQERMWRARIAALEADASARRRPPGQAGETRDPASQPEAAA